MTFLDEAKGLATMINNEVGIGPDRAPRPHSRRRFLGVAGGVAATGTMGLGGGCAVSAGDSDSGAGGGPNQPITLQILGQPTEIDDTVIKGFAKEHPEIELSIAEYSWDTLVAMLAAKTPPDIVRGAGATDTPYLVARELAEPLDEYVAQSKIIKTDDLDPINDLWRYDGTTQGKGTLYGLVKDYSSDLTVWVNANHLESAGLDVPNTERPISYDQLLELATKTNQVKGGRTAVLGFGCVFASKSDLAWLQGMMATAGGSLFTPDLGAVDLTSDAGLRALTWLVELVTSKTTSSFLAPQSNPDVDLYVANRVSTFLSGYWTCGMIATAKPEVREASYLLPAPQLGDVRVSPCIGGTGMWIPKASTNKQAAWTFMEYYFGGQAATDRAKSGWGVPGLTSMLDLLPEDEPYQKRALKVQREERKYFEVLPFTPHAKADALGTTFAATFEEAVRKKQPVRELADRATTALNDAIARGKE